MSTGLDFKTASREHIKNLDRVIDKGGTAQLKKLYDRAQAELESKLGRIVGKRSVSPITIHEHRALLAQVKQGQMHIAKAMGQVSTQATVQTQHAALNGLISTVKRMENRTDASSPVVHIEEAARFEGILDKRKSSLLKQNLASMTNYGAGVIKKMEGQLSLSLATGETAHDAIGRISKVANVEYWRAERIVRTEQAWAFNATTADGIAAAAERLGGMWSRWTELVDDDSLEPLDDRVGADSVAMHGQVVKPGGLFTMPSSARSVEIQTRYGVSTVDSDMIGKSWAHPPNRPNDRATIVPWRPDWGDATGWQVVGGRKVEVRMPKPNGRARR